MLAALPADVGLILGVEAGSLRDSGLGRAVLADGLLSGGELAQDTLLLLGSPDGAELFDRGRFGCADDGCLGLLEGQFEELSIDRMRQGMARALPHGATVSAADEGFDLRSGSEHLALRRLSQTKAIIGDAAPMARAAEAQARLSRAEEVETLDVAELQGLVPAGAAWLVAPDGPRGLELLAGRFSKESSMTPQLAALTRMASRWAALDQPVEAAALSLDLDPTADSGTLRLRVRAADVSSARHFARLAQAALVAPPRQLAGLLDAARVVRDEARVEVAMPITGETLAAWQACSTDGATR